MTDNSGTLLRDQDLAHIGKASEPQHEIVNRRDIRKYSIATAQKQQRYLAGDVAPPLFHVALFWPCLLYTSPSPRDLSTSRMPSSA